jgi:hypothetical protein
LLSGRRDSSRLMPGSQPTAFHMQQAPPSRWYSGNCPQLRPDGPTRNTNRTAQETVNSDLFRLYTHFI